MNLVNHFLIATPSIQSDPYFSDSVVYIVQQYEHGTVGITINKPININVQDILIKADIEPSAAILSPNSLNVPALQTGPVNSNTILTLHLGKASDYYWSAAVTDQVAVTFSGDILSTLGTLYAPQQFLLGCGYAFWTPEQLEQEIRYNAWLTVPAQQQIIFNVPIDERREAALDLLGIKPHQLSHLNGHA